MHHLITFFVCKTRSTSWVPLHNWFWVSGHYLLMVTVLSVFLGFLPLVVNFGDIGVLKNSQQRTYILNSMNSTQWQFALVANVALAAPIMFDHILEEMQRQIFGTRARSEALVPHLVLTISLLLPNILLLCVCIPLEYPELVMCFHNARIGLITYGTLGHIWISGGDRFKTSNFFLGHVVLAIALIIASYDSINESQVSPMFWIGNCMGSLGVILITPSVLKLFKTVRTIGIRNLDNELLSCLVDIILIGLIGGISIITGMLYRGHYDSFYFIFYTYIEGGFTLIITVLQGRLTRITLNNKEVGRRNCEI